MQEFAIRTQAWRDLRKDQHGVKEREEVQKLRQENDVAVAKLPVNPHAHDAEKEYRLSG